MIVILLIGIQPIALIIIGTVTPPLGREYDDYFVDKEQRLLLTTIVNGGTYVYLLLLSPVLVYWRVYRPACTIELADRRKNVFWYPNRTDAPFLCMKEVTG